MQRLALALILALGAGSLLAAPAWGAGFVVDSSDDEGDLALDGTCDSLAGAGGKCTLRAAVQEANSVAGADLISVPGLPGGYDLALTGSGDDAALSGDLDLTDSVTIQGSGAPVVDGIGADRVFDVGPSGAPAVTLRGIEVRGGGGVAVGGGVLVEGGTLALDQVTVGGNAAASASSTAVGGGVWINAPGIHQITASTLSGNIADGVSGATGGGLDRKSTRLTSSHRL